MRKRPSFLLIKKTRHTLAPFQTHTEITLLEIHLERSLGWWDPPGQDLHALSPSRRFRS